MTTNTLEVHLRNKTQFPRYVAARVLLPPGDDWYDGFSLELDTEGETVKTLEGPLGGTLEVYAGEPWESPTLLKKIALPPIELAGRQTYDIDVDR
ncbi:hypothetical protein HY251_13720 [bacterium]|nr:hypothetical protein [bacterium]